jgi:ribosomal protein L10
MQVTNAITRQKKEEIVADLKEKLNNSVIVFGLRYKGLDVSALGQPRSSRRAQGLQEAATHDLQQLGEADSAHPA